MQYINGSKQRHVAAAMLLGLTWLVSARASADPKSCITAHSTGQREAKAGHLRLATQLFTTCGSDDTCPHQLRQECAELLQSVEQTVPTVIFSVTDEKNHDVSTVKVFSTDELVVDGLDGRAIQIDPGKHRLRFLLPWGAVLSSDVLIREGEKNRMISVRIQEEDAERDPNDPASTTPPSPTSAPKAAPIAPTPPAASQPSSALRSGPPLGAWIATGAAAVGFGVGTSFALLGKSKKDEIQACSPNCGSDQRSTYDGLKRDFIIADIGFAVGVLSAGVATWLFLAPRSARTESSSGAVARAKPLVIRPIVAPLPAGGAVMVSGQF